MTPPLDVPRKRRQLDDDVRAVDGMLAAIATTQQRRGDVLESECHDPITERNIWPTWVMCGRTLSSSSERTESPDSCAERQWLRGNGVSSVRECRTMTPPQVMDVPRFGSPSSDPHDRALVRHMLSLTPDERLRNVSAYWPLMRVGLERRAMAGASRS